MRRENIMSEQFTIENPMPPEWLMYPEIPLGSIGWRMGYGESYVMYRYSWFDKLSNDEQERYNELFPKPKMWEFDNFCRRGDMNGIIFWKPEGKPAYGKEDLCLDHSEGKRLDYLFFWGHQPKKEGSLSESCFSNWWFSPFQVSVTTYNFVEQFMMSYKADLFNDKEMSARILESSNPSEIKKLGRMVHNFDEVVWNEYKYSIMLNALYAKFMQNQQLKQFLLSTGEKILVEASPYDKIWGIGLKKEDAKVTSPLKWKGENLLGFALMEVREEIRRICKNENMISWDSVDERFDISKCRLE